MTLTKRLPRLPQMALNVAQVPQPEFVTESQPVVTNGKTLECWVDYFTTPLKDVLVKGRPERIWTSDDPQWDALEERGKYLTVSISVGWVRRVGDDFLPGGGPKNPNPRVRDHFRVTWQTAREMMKLFESQQRVFETPTGDLVEAEKEATERGQKEQAATIVAALREFAQTMLKGNEKAPE